MYRLERLSMRTIPPSGSLSWEGGCYGLLATTNIAEGSAITVGLGEIIKVGDIVYACKSVKWPGKASVVTATVCFYKGLFNGPKSADGRECGRIGSRLEPETASGWKPKALESQIFSFAGVDNSKGLAFVLAEDDPWYARLKAENRSLLRPYITGKDITSHALHRVERWALDIGDLSLEDIEAGWPVAYQFLLQVVKPTRTREALKNYKGLYNRWWQFWNHRAKLVRRVRRHSKCIVYSKVTKHPICMLADPRWVYTNQVVLIGCERDDLLAICFSCFFNEWLVAQQGAKFVLGRVCGCLLKKRSTLIPCRPRPSPNPACPPHWSSTDWRTNGAKQNLLD